MKKTTAAAGSSAKPAAIKTCRDCTAGPDAVPTIFFVGAGPGATDLITVRGWFLLKDADVILYAGALVNPELDAISKAALKIDSRGMKLEDQIALPS